jgi:hypothetical protein
MRSEHGFISSLCSCHPTPAHPLLRIEKETICPASRDNARRLDGDPDGSTASR